MTILSINTKMNTEYRVKLDQTVSEMLDELSRKRSVKKKVAKSMIDESIKYARTGLTHTTTMG